MTYTLHLGDCLEVMKSIPDKSIDAVVTDPPYGLQFMGKEWDKLWRNSTEADRDYQERTKDKGDGLTSRARNLPDYSAANNYEMQRWHEQWATEVYRILKPGGHVLSFGGTRTYHRMACAIEDAGFEIRDQLQWLYGSGFPKSLNIGKQDGCEYWQGYGTALKPAHEPICMARKPFKGTVANNVLTYGTGGINIDGCRVGSEGVPLFNKDNQRAGTSFMVGSKRTGETSSQGRFPANILHDGSDEVVGMFPASKARTGKIGSGGNGTSIFGTDGKITARYDDTETSAARFFYSAKASRTERNAGLEGMEEKRPHPEGNGYGLTTMWNGENGDEEWRKKNPNTPAANHHPTVKPIAVMRWLVRLITPPNGTVLDPFTGSGTTGIAAVMEGFDFIGIEREPEYHEIARRRIENAAKGLQIRLPIDANR